MTRAWRIVGLALLLAGAGAAEEKRSGAPAVVIGKETISEAQLEERIRPRLFELENRAYQLKSQALDDLLVEREAKLRGIAAAALLKAEVEDKAAPLPEAELEAAVAAALPRYPGQDPAAVRQGVLQALKAERAQARRADFLRELRGRHGVSVRLEPPRMTVDPGPRPARGGARAPVTLVEFSDFQCPYCGRAAPVLKRLEQRYAEKLRVYFRDFPLQIHPLAPKAAEAGACAAEQGRFWDMHDRLFEKQDELQVPALKKHAADLGLDPQRFDECLDSGRHEGAWKKDVEDGTRYGVSGTPAFFINGRMLVGAQPYEAFVGVIEEELQRGARPPAK